MGGKIFDVTFDPSTLDRVRFRLGDMEKRAPSVMANALNQTLTVMKRYIPKQVKKAYTYKRTLQKPTAVRSKYSNLRAYLKYMPIPFERIKDISYQSFQFRRGALGMPRNSPGKKFKVKVRRDEGFREKDRVFFNKDTVFRRKKGQDRYPIFYASGPSEHTMVKQVWRGKQEQQYIGKILSQKLDQQIDKAYLNKWRGK